MRHFEAISRNRHRLLNPLNWARPEFISGYRRIFILKFLAILLLTACAAQNPKQEDLIQYYEVETLKPYDDVLAELKIAISEHNFRITAHSRVGKVIRDRGTLDFPDYDTIQFCNLSRAKILLEISPDAVRHMPCSVVVYTRNGRNVIQARLLPVDTDNPELNKFSGSINEMLRQIVDFAAEI